MQVSKNLDIGRNPEGGRTPDAEKDAVLIEGQLDLSGTSVGGFASLRNLTVIGPLHNEHMPDNAILGESLTAGLDLDFVDCTVVGGAALTQAHVGGTCHVKRSVFIAHDLATSPQQTGKGEEQKNDTRWRRHAPGFDLTSVDDGEIALSFLRSTFGRSLKIRESTALYGVLGMRAATIGNDLELWLWSLAQPGEANTSTDGSASPQIKTVLDALREHLHATFKVEPPEFHPPQTIALPSMMEARRAWVSGTIFLGHSADPDDTAARKPPADPTQSNEPAPDPQSQPWFQKCRSPSDDHQNTKRDDHQNTKRLLDRDDGGFMDLSFLSVGTLRDSEESWPAPGRLDLNGFSYDRIDAVAGVPIKPSKRIEWFDRVYRTPFDGKQNGYSPALLYDQLFTVYMRLGLPDYAEDVDVTKRRRITLYGKDGLLPSGNQYTLFRKAFIFIGGMLWHLGYGVMTYYGYRPLRAAFVLIVWFLLGWMVFDSAEHATAFEHNADTPPPMEAAPQTGTPLNTPSRHQTGTQVPTEENTETDQVRIGKYPYTITRSCVIPAQEEYYTNYMVRTRHDFLIGANDRVLNDQEHLSLKGYPGSNSFLHTVDSLVPFDLYVDKYWMLSDAGNCRSAVLKIPNPAYWAPYGLRSILKYSPSIPIQMLPVHLSTQDTATPRGEHWSIRYALEAPFWYTYPIGISFRALQVIFVFVGYILVAILATAAAGLLRPRVEPPQVPSRHGGGASFGPQ